MFDGAHLFGRMEARRATKRNVNFPTLAQPNPQGSRPGRNRWGTRREKRRGQIKACPARLGLEKSMAPTPHHPLHLAAACTDATAHPQHGHHRTTNCTTCSVRSPGMCTPHRQAKCPDTTAPGPRSRVPFLPSTRHTSCHHSTRVGRLAGKVKALLRFAFTRQVTYEMRLLDAVPLNPGLWKKDHDLSMLIQWKCKADMKCAEGAQIIYFLCLVTQISNVGLSARIPSRLPRVPTL